MSSKAKQHILNYIYVMHASIYLLFMFSLYFLCISHYFYKYLKSNIYIFIFVYTNIVLILNNNDIELQIIFDLLSNLMFRLQKK